MRWFVPTTIGSALAVALVVQQPGSAQVPAAGPGDSHRVTLAAISPVEVTQAAAMVNRLARSGELASVGVQNDAGLAGRVIESFQQVYRGIPVEGGSLTVHSANGATISILGTVFDGVAIDPTPALTAIDAARIIENASRTSIAFGTTPTLVILPSPSGAFALVYRAAVEDAVTYYVDASSGAIVRVIDAKDADVGTGTGVLGDQKKMATTLVGATYRAKDSLRPGGISTFDTGGSTTTYNRLINTGVTTDADVASNGNNTWNDGYVVDAHTNTAATFDYFYRRHNWTGLDNRSRPLSTIVHNGIKDNAFFYPAPFGPNQGGAMVFGVTSAGNVPYTVLDVAAHELMHGVTSFSVANRTGSSLVNLVWTSLGPTSFVYKGTTWPCNSTFWLDSQGVLRPSYCVNGQYVLGSTQAGALNEGYSDVFGTSVEFFYQAPGSGPLKADYLIGEDMAGAAASGLLRSLSNPGSIALQYDSGTIPYPDHMNRLVTFALYAASGTSANPTTVGYTGAGFSNGAFLPFFSNSIDNGGVHYNSTIISHAFYLAVEGGRNATSGISVTGVGGQNREQIEKIFFRAMTQLMPNSANLPIAAAAIVLAATDLYGASGAPTQAVTQALTAVGLR